MAAALHFLQGATGTRQLCPVSRQRLAVWGSLLETAALLPGVPGFQPCGFLCRAMLLFGALSPQLLCHPTSDRLLMPDIPQYLPGLLATPWDQRCFTWALFSRLCRAFRPGHHAVVALVLLHQGQLHQITSKMFSGLHCLILRTIRKP